MSEDLKFLEGFKGVKTFKSGYGSMYAVIAEAKGLALSIAPKIIVGPIIGISIRLRVQKTADWANLSDAAEIFGFSELIERSPNHASCDLYVAVGVAPVTPYQVGQIIAEQKILESIVKLIAGRSKLAVPEEDVLEYIRNVFEDRLPSAPQKQLAEFPVVIGESSIKEHLIQLTQTYFPQPAE